MRTMLNILNPLLYERLQEVFGEVRVSSEGDLGTLIPPDVLDRHARGGNNRKKIYASPGDWGEVYHVCCPACGDRRFRLYICYMSHTKARIGKAMCHIPWVFDCKNEHCRPELQEYFTRVFQDMAVQDLQKMTPATLKGPPKESITGLLSLKVTVPKPLINLQDSQVLPSALDYLVSRGFDPLELSTKWGCKYIPEGASWKSQDGTKERFFREHQLFCPGIEGRRLLGWQTRILRVPHPKEPKYSFMPGGVRYLYNLDNALKYKDVMIVEGFTDVWWAGDDSFAMMGHTLTDRQRFCIRTVWGMWGRGVFMVEKSADGSVETSVGKQVRRLVAAGAFPDGVALVHLDGRDPQEHPKDELRALFGAALERADHSMNPIQEGDLL